MNTPDNVKSFIIDGVNVEIGLNRSGGRIKSYKKILSSFHSDVTNKVKEIETCYSCKDILLYTTYVHGLKTALANIGAVKLSETSKTLEDAGNVKDWDYISNHNDAFINQLKSLLESVDNFLNSFSINSDKADFDQKEILLSLNKLKQGIDDYDFNIIKKSTIVLEKYEELPNIGRCIKSILKKITIGEYDAIVSEIDKLIKKINN